jgi:predicted transcriptional regulator
MKKNVLISFRTNESLRMELEEVAKAENRSMASVIESAISVYMEGRKDQASTERERRRHARKIVAAPVFISRAGSAVHDRRTGVIIDISLSGVRISVPKNCTLEICLEDKDSQLETVFALPNESRPIQVKCRPESLFHTNGDVHIGASFVDADFQSYQAIRDYLV